MNKITEQRFLEAYELYADAIFRYCFFRIWNREEASDLMQETFTKTWKYVSERESVDNIRAFLYQVARNLVIDTVRKRRPTISVDYLAEVGLEPSQDSRERLFNYLDGSLLLDVLDELEPAYREVLLLRYVQGLRPKEIAHLLEVSPNALSVRLHQAKRMLKARYHSKPDTQYETA